MNLGRFRLILITIVFFGVFCINETFAQGEQKYITFSGFVIDSKTDEPLPGAYIINQRAGRGTLTNSKGYFILDVFPSDSIVFSYLGFKKQYHIIPRKAELNYSAVVELNEDAKMLKEVKVYPFRTEEEFKNALIAMTLPDAKDREILEKNYGRENIARSVAMQGMGSGANYRYAMDQQLMAIQSRGQITTNPFLNPMAWMSFINSVKKGSFRDKSYNKAEYRPSEKGNRDNIFKNGN